MFFDSWERNFQACPSPFAGRKFIVVQCALTLNALEDIIVKTERWEEVAVSGLDVKQFWAENERCFGRFDVHKPRVPISFWLDDHFLLEAMRLPSTLRYYRDEQYRLSVHRAYNQITRRILGRTFYDEDPAPQPVRFEVLMGAKWEMREGGTPWLESEVKDERDLKRVVERMERMEVEREMFAGEWPARVEAYLETHDALPPMGGGSRAPVTMATSILGTENFCYFLYDEPELMTRFFEALSKNLVRYQLALRKLTGNGRSGYSFTDDNCYLMTPELYRKFAMPAMERILSALAPGKDDVRHQHSDSDMGHLMPLLNELGINAVNLGPNIDPRDIRRAMPEAVIEGQIPPFLLRNGTKEEIFEAVRQDIEKVGADGGLVECTAGSVTGGTPLENILAYMEAVDRYGRIYD